jgi:hypothetical protein
MIILLAIQYLSTSLKVGFLHQQTVEYEAALRLINKCSVNNS